MEWLRDCIWGGPLLALFAITGIYLTIRLRGVQFRHLGSAFTQLTTPASGSAAPGEISGFQALTTSLAGAVGTGSVAGVATAVTIGGPGALLWMWVAAFLCMSISYTEAFLSIRYRVRTPSGETAGGPMYVLERGLGSRPLALAFALAAAVGSFGIGSTVQAHSVADAMNSTYGVPALASGFLLAVCTALVVLGGIRSIGQVTSWLVPVMSLLYASAAIVVLAYHWEHLPAAFSRIVSEAFTGEAAIGGAAGGSWLVAMRIGFARSVFCNEAGMGSGAIAAASARTEHPAQQALLQMAGVFVSTCIICTLSGLVVVVSDVPAGTDGASRALACFAAVWGPLRHLVVIGLLLFAYSTVLAWAYYGEKCTEYLFGARVVPAYRWIYTLTLLIGVVMPMGGVWAFADVANAMMAIPNLIGVLALSGVAVSETHDYFNRQKKLVHG